MNPIIFLWCHPRSMSTAVERIMRERGDCTCFHEPFMYDYYVARAVRQMPHFEVEPDRPRQYSDIKVLILNEAESRPVFVKDMAYYIVPRLFDDLEFARRLTHCFLVRDPLKSIPSYYRLDADLTCEEVGLEAQWRLHDWLANNLGIQAPVLEANAVQEDPQGTISQLWKRIGLPPCPTAFEWHADQTPEDWQQVAGWHNHAQSTTAICKPECETEHERREAFDTATRDAPHLQDFLEHHLPFFERLKALAIESQA